MMRYLFFDIECANCFDGTGKICEFGYVLTDENFCIEKQDLILIDPQASFDPYVIDNMLAFNESTYNSSPTYKQVFNKIKLLFELSDILILGHTIDADVKYLNDEAKRFKLPYFSFSFFDVKYLYMQFAGLKHSVRVKKICEVMKLPVQNHEHRSVDDAIATMRIVEAMIKEKRLSLQQFIDSCEDCKGDTIDGNITTIAREKAKKRREKRERILQESGIKDSNKIYGNNYYLFMQFLAGVKPQGEIVQNMLTGKSISISLNFQLYHFREMLGVIQLLKNYGCEYKLKASECDYFVPHTFTCSDGSEMSDSKRKYVEEAILNGKNIKIISLDELFELLQTNEQALMEIPFPDKSSFVKKGKRLKKSPKEYNEVSCSISLGDLLKNEGIAIKGDKL